MNIKPLAITDSNGCYMGKFSSRKAVDSFVKRQLAFQEMPMWLNLWCDGEHLRVEKLA